MRTLKLSPQKWLTYFPSKYNSVMYNWNQNSVLTLKMNVTLALLLTFSYYFMKSICIKMKKFGIIYQKFAPKLRICLSYIMPSPRNFGLFFDHSKRWCDDANEKCMSRIMQCLKLCQRWSCCLESKCGTCFWIRK